MATATLTPSTGHVRLQVRTAAGRSVYVGPFATLGGARRLAEDLISEGAVRVVRVEHKARGCWTPAWSFQGGAR